MLSAAEQLRHLKQGVVDIVSEAELLKKLEKSVATGKPLKIKAGFDPSRPDLHLGHTVLINKMRQFQQLGHEITFLIGDITGMVGDPSGKSETRKPLTKEEVAVNAKTYARQVFKILDEEKTIVDYNSRWFEKFTIYDFFKLAGQSTVARMLERDDFEKRYKSGSPISIHEFIYPLLQGYDSVALKSDVELGGTDQRFNLLMGRDLQKHHGIEPQVVMTLPLLVGLDGVKKMSKSEDNYISVEDTAQDIFGKTMRVSDELMIQYYELLTDIRPDELKSLQEKMKSGELNPRDVKVRLAKEFVTRFYSAADADAAEAEFKKIFSAKGLPTEIAEFKISPQEIGICKLIHEAGCATSSSEAKRLVEGGGVEKDSAKVTDSKLKMNLKSGESFVLKVGKKRFIKVVVS